MGDEELATVSPWAGICHRKYARFVVPSVGVELVTEFVSGIAGACSGRVAALRHEVWDHAVKGNVVVEA